MVVSEEELVEGSALTPTVGQTNTMQITKKIVKVDKEVSVLQGKVCNSKINTQVVACLVRINLNYHRCLIRWPWEG